MWKARCFQRPMVVPLAFPGRIYTGRRGEGTASQRAWKRGVDPQAVGCPGQFDPERATEIIRSWLRDEVQ